MRTASFYFLHSAACARGSQEGRSRRPLDVPRTSSHATSAVEGRAPPPKCLPGVTARSAFPHPLLRVLRYPNFQCLEIAPQLGPVQVRAEHGAQPVASAFLRPCRIQCKHTTPKLAPPPLSLSGCVVSTVCLLSGRSLLTISFSVIEK